MSHQPTAVERALRAQRTEAFNAVAQLEAANADLRSALEAATRANAVLQSQLDDSRAQLVRAAA